MKCPQNVVACGEINDTRLSCPSLMKIRALWLCLC